MAVDLAALRAQHPEWNLADAIEAPGGGIWALGADGGVFALGGAPFHGSYMGESAQTRLDPTRRFTGIQRVGGGYKLLTDRPWEGYNYGPQDQPEPGGPGTTEPGATEPGAPAPPDPGEKLVSGLLERMGLNGLFDMAWKYWKGLGGAASIEALNVWLRTSDEAKPAFDARFPGIPDDWDPGQYVSYESKVRNTLAEAGLPPGLFDTADEIGEFLKKGWSPDEITDAITAAGNGVLTMPAEDRAALQAWGLTDGDMTAFWLNPDRATPFLERKVQAAAAGIAGGATRAGFDTAFGGLSLEESRGLLTTGRGTAEQFAAVAAQAAVFAETAEEVGDLGRETALGVVGGEAGATEAVRRRRAAREARFAGGGGAAKIGSKQSGLGTAQ